MANTNEFIIQTQSLAKQFGDVHALKGVDLNVPKNSIFGFLGPNGAGKTTTMKILLGLAQPTTGSGKIFGHDIVEDSLAIRERIGYLPQQPRFIEYMTARENLMFAAKFFFSGPEKIIRKRCEEMLELVGLHEKGDRPVKGFSGGEKQRLGIALAQINQPDLLILDEPASALDPIGRQAVLEIMEQLRENTTIFYSTHILDDVQRVSDTVAILNNGKVVASGPIDQILNRKDGVVYSLKIKGTDDTFLEKISKISWVTNVKFSPHNGTNTWDIGINDDQQAEKHLLRIVLENPEINVIEFSRKKYELEEVFMDIVKGDNNDH